MKHWSIIPALAVLAASSLAAADPKVRVEPAKVRPGDAVLVVVTNTDSAPVGTAGDTELQFFKSKRGGYQAVFAMPLTGDYDNVTIKVGGVAKPITVKVTSHVFSDAKVAVEEELANPEAAERGKIDADNKAMITASRATNGEPQFTRPFVGPRGKVTSVFGEWRTFNDGHRSQHLGYDVFAKVGTKVRAINRGTVTFVGETLLGGNVVFIGHGAGISSAYMHLKDATVALGDVVEQGAEIGHSGQTGRTTGPHLHVAVRVPGGFIDPQRFFRLKLTPVITPAKR